jgi:hypothetical protein
MSHVPPGRAGRREPASSVAPVASGYERSLRPWLAPPIAPGQRVFIPKRVLTGAESRAAYRVRRRAARRSRRNVAPKARLVRGLTKVRTQPARSARSSSCGSTRVETWYLSPNATPHLRGRNVQ